MRSHVSWKYALPFQVNQSRRSHEGAAWVRVTDWPFVSMSTVAVVTEIVHEESEYELE